MPTPVRDRAAGHDRTLPTRIAFTARRRDAGSTRVPHGPQHCPGSATPHSSSDVHATAARGRRGPGERTSVHVGVQSRGGGMVVGGPRVAPASCAPIVGPVCAMPGTLTACDAGGAAVCAICARVAHARAEREGDDDGECPRAGHGAKVTRAARRVPRAERPARAMCFTAPTHLGVRRTRTAP